MEIDIATGKRKYSKHIFNLNVNAARTFGQNSKQTASTVPETNQSNKSSDNRTINSRTTTTTTTTAKKQ
jgi:hypothetical protein